MLHIFYRFQSHLKLFLANDKRYAFLNCAFHRNMTSKMRGMNEDANGVKILPAWDLQRANSFTSPPSIEEFPTDGEVVGAVVLHLLS